MKQLNVEAMLSAQRQFVRERRWEQFHTPKNLATALTVEAAELMEIFQWLTPSEAKRVMRNADRAQAVSDELADVFYYLLRMADVLQVDLQQAFENKMKRNREKYPVKLARGKAAKYTEFLKHKGLHPRSRKKSEG